jgi:Pilin (bacterial filament)
MNKTLIILILAVIVLSWNFVFTDKKKIELTDSAKVLQGLSMAMKYKIAIKEYWQGTGVLPDAEAWQKAEKKIEVDLSKSLVKNIEVAADGPGIISVYFTNKETVSVAKDIAGKKVMLMPEAKGKRLVWACKGTLQKEYLPSKCQ